MHSQVVLVDHAHEFEHPAVWADFAQPSVVEARATTATAHGARTTTTFEDCDVVSTNALEQTGWLSSSAFCTLVSKSIAGSAGPAVTKLIADVSTGSPHDSSIACTRKTLPHS